MKSGVYIYSRHKINGTQPPYNYSCSWLTEVCKGGLAPSPAYVGFSGGLLRNSCILASASPQGPSWRWVPWFSLLQHRKITFCKRREEFCCGAHSPILYHTASGFKQPMQHSECMASCTHPCVHYQHCKMDRCTCDHHIITGTKQLVSKHAIHESDAYSQATVVGYVKA